MKKLLLLWALLTGLSTISCSKNTQEGKEDRISEMMVKIKKIAEQNPDGFTIYTTNLEFVTHGWVVGMLETQNSFGDEGLLKVIRIADSTTQTMGGWLEQGLFYWDACYIIEDEETATELGRRNQQIAIYHLDTGTLKYL